MIFTLILVVLVNQILSSSTLWSSDQTIISPFYEGKNSRSNSVICSGEVDEECIINKWEINDDTNSLKRLFYRLNGQQTKNLSKKRVGMALDSGTTGQCQCGVTFEPRDLGSNYHPRYIYTGICKRNMCGLFQKCQPRKYTLKLLKKKDTQNEVAEAENQDNLPESLQENWISEELKIIVACECAPKRSN